MASGAFFFCLYCHFSSTEFGEIVDHNILCHSKQELKCQIQRESDGKSLSKIRNFHVVPDNVKSENKYIMPDNSNWTISIHEYTEKSQNDFGPSPAKQIRQDNYLFQGITSNDGNESIDHEKTIWTAGPIQRMGITLPDIISNLQKEGELTTYLQFNELLASGSFPFENIAYRLFCDIVIWHSLDNSSSMRYPELVKRFWRTGYKLFKGKFSRFMSGLKNVGNVNSGVAEKGKCSPSISEVNFIVPSLSVLGKMETPVSSEDFQPGCIDIMLNMVHDNDPDKIATFKLCVDGKKINFSTIGNLGEVNLWGHENQPTLSTKKARFSQDKMLMDRLKQSLLDVQKYENISKCPMDTKSEIKLYIVDAIKIISEIIRDLRKSKVAKKIAYEIFLKMTQRDWRKSKYAFVISSLKTSLFEISSCIEDALACINKLGLIAAEISNLQNLYCTGTTVNFCQQENSVCLPESKTDFPKQSSLVKQKSDKWHKLRKMAHVTGSTCNKAVGLETLKKQQQHYKQVFNDENVSLCNSREVQDRLDHGNTNELNGVATLVGKILPVLYGNVSYFEEGCYRCETDSQLPSIIVSPDGSVRNDIEEVVFGIEIKCPFSGKLYTTPIHYTIPEYYISQIVSEMVALKPDKLIFLSYSHESTSVIAATFDDYLWTLMYRILNDVYGDEHKLPTKLHPLLPELRQCIKDYSKTHVKFIVEMASAIAVPCKHVDITQSTVRFKHRTEIFSLIFCP